MMIYLTLMASRDISQIILLINGKIMKAQTLSWLNAYLYMRTDIPSFFLL